MKGQEWNLVTCSTPRFMVCVEELVWLNWTNIDGDEKTTGSHHGYHSVRAWWIGFHDRGYQILWKDPEGYLQWYHVTQLQTRFYKANEGCFCGYRVTVYITKLIMCICITKVKLFCNAHNVHTFTSSCPQVNTSTWPHVQLASTGPQIHS